MERGFTLATIENVLVAGSVTAVRRDPTWGWSYTFTRGGAAVAVSFRQEGAILVITVIDIG